MSDTPSPSSLPDPRLMEKMIEKKLESVYAGIKELSARFPSTGAHMSALRGFVKEGQYSEAACFVYRLVEGALCSEADNQEGRDEYVMHIVNVSLFITAVQFEAALLANPDEALWNRVEAAGKRAGVIRDLMKGAAS